MQTRAIHIADTEKIPNIKELVALAKDSALAKVYIMQLAKAHYRSPCYTFLYFIEEQIGLILSSMPSKINDREVRSIIDFT